MKNVIILVVVLVAAVAGVLRVKAVSAPLMVGAGKAEIVVPRGIGLSGYGGRINKPNIGTHDPVYVRALILESGGKRAAIIGADLLECQPDIRNDLWKAVADLKLDFLSISVTHTHYSMGQYIDDPMMVIAVMGRYKPEARAIVMAALEKAVREAAKNMQPARVGAGIGKAPGVTANRRHEGGPTDERFGALGIWSMDDKLIAAIMNHAIHPTTVAQNDMQVSGDVAGRAESWMEEKHPGAVAIFMNAGLGDQRPLEDWTTGDWDDVEKIGSAMGARADEILATVRPAAEVEMVFYDHRFKLPPVQVNPAFKCWYGLAPLVKQVGKGLAREEGQFLGLGLNDALLLFSPAEITVGVQKNLEAAFPERKVFVVSHSNDWYGYVVLPDDWETGGYETCMSLYGRDFEPMLEREFKAMVSEKETATRDGGGP